MARQLRLALSMNGGVSLAVWIGGAVAEIDELRRGVGFWGDLLESCGYERQAQVDVVAGASAGGLNGVLLAQAIRTATPFHTFLPLWRDLADIDQLVKFGDEVNDADGTRSLMRGTYFRTELEAALPEDPKTSLVGHDLQLFASATLLVGNRETYNDVRGAPLVERRSGSYFTVARRGAAARGLDGFHQDDNRAMLARIGRATSSLPGGFEPEPFTDADTRSRLSQAFSPRSSAVEVIDGGVLDNVPIARAIKAIGSSRAKGATRRVLVYLHPDPSEQDERNPTSALGVVSSFTGKRQESLREDIDELRSHNDTVVAQRQAIVNQIELLLNGAFAGRPADQLHVESAAALLMRCAVAPDAEISWHSPVRVRWTSMIDRDDGMSVEELRRAIDSALATRETDLLPSHRTARLVRAVQWLVSDAERVTGVDLGPVKSELYEIELVCDLLLGYQLGQFVSATTPEGAVASLTASAATVESLPSALTDELWQALASWELDDRDGAEPTATLLAALFAQLMAGVNDLAPATPLGETLVNYLEGADDNADEPPPASLSVLLGLCGRRGEVTWDELDLTFAPLAMSRYVNARPIEFVRIAGDAASPAATRFTDVNEAFDNPKIAGQQLGHLGAFFDRSWRENDWRWGRLDAVPGLASALIDEQAMAAYNSGSGTNIDAEALVAKIVLTRQHQLVNQFANSESPDPLGDPWFANWSNRDHRVASLIGTATLTRTGLRAVLGAKRLLTHKGNILTKVLGVGLLPLVLALAGIGLAGRRATAATTWTICVLAAPRLETSGARWVVWSLGLAAAAGIAFVTEKHVKPTQRPLWWQAYILALLGAAFGVVLLLFHADYLEGAVPQLEGLRWAWMVAALAAAISTAMLFYWMPSIWKVTSLILAAVMYGFGAWFDTQAREHPSADWAQFWPLHTLWVYWTAVVLIAPFVLSKWDRVLLPRSDP